MATISKSHIINQASQAILDNILVINHFIKRPLQPDYHVDYFGEVVEDDNPSGIYFGIQLKGIEKIQIIRNDIKLSLKTKHLYYYLDKVKSFPVFLIVVDVLSKKAYYLFLQKYLNEEILNMGWRNQKNVLIHISQSNEINDLQSLKKTIIDADKYMKALSLPASIKQQKEFFSQLDSRFEMDSIGEKDGNIKYTFKQIKDVNIGLLFKDKSKEKFEKYLDNFSEEKISFDKGEIDVVDSALLKYLFDKAGRIEFDLLPPTIENLDVYLTIKENNNLFSDTIHFNGKLSYHKSYLKLDCAQNDLPLKILAVLDADMSKKHNLNFNFDFTRWINTPVKYLPYLNRFYEFFQKFNESNKLILKAEYSGQLVFDSVLNVNNRSDFMNYVNDYLSLCYKLKIVDSFYNLNLNFPGLPEIKWEEKSDIEMLFNLITYGEHEERNKVYSININAKKEYSDRLVDGTNLSFVTDLKCTLLGKEINIESINVAIINPKLRINDTGEEYIPVEITTNKNSNLFYLLLILLKNRSKKNYLNRKCDKLDKQIDELVYQLYGLTDEEIKILGGAFNNFF
jgi:hypothetical protein